MVLVLTARIAAGQSASSGGLDLQELNRQINNPLSRIWSLAFQNDNSAVMGDLLPETGHVNVATFQPILPMPVGDKYTFFARPVLPLISVPIPQSTLTFPGGRPELPRGPFPQLPITFSGPTTGLGDLVLAAGLGQTKARGFTWAFGSTFVFPTASRSFLGQEKWQAGPAAVGVYMGKTWTLGLLGQQWWSYAGNENRAATNHMNTQYFIIRQLPRHWEIRTSPNILVDWRAKHGKLTFPIGAGVGKLLLLGRLPVKLSAEFQYAVVSPDLAGTRWIFRGGMNFVIPNPFSPITAQLKN